MWIRIAAGLAAGIAMGEALLFMMIYSGFSASWQFIALLCIAACAMPLCLRFGHGALLARIVMWTVSLAINLGYVFFVSICGVPLVRNIMLVHLAAIATILLAWRANAERNK